MVQANASFVTNLRHFHEMLKKVKKGLDKLKEMTRIQPARLNKAQAEGRRAQGGSAGDRTGTPQFNKFNADTIATLTGPTSSPQANRDKHRVDKLSKDCGQ